MKKLLLCINLVIIMFAISCGKNSVERDKEMLMKYIKSKDIENTEKLIKKGMNVNYFFKGNSPLTMACLKGQYSIVKLLIESGAKIEKSERGMSPLRGAFINDNLKIMKYLINHGADVNLKDQNGESLLMFAAAMGKPHIVKLLLQNGAEVNVKDKKNTSAMFYLIKKIPANNPNCFSKEYKQKYHVDYLKTLKELINAGADVNNSELGGGTILMWACQSRQIQVVEMIIKAGADVNKIHITNITALDIAICNKFKKAEQILRKHSAKTATELEEEKSVEKKNNLQSTTNTKAVSP